MNEVISISGSEVYCVNWKDLFVLLLIHLNAKLDTTLVKFTKTGQSLNLSHERIRKHFHNHRFLICCCILLVEPCDRVFKVILVLVFLIGTHYIQDHLIFRLVFLSQPLYLSFVKSHLLKQLLKLVLRLLRFVKVVNDELLRLLIWLGTEILIDVASPLKWLIVFASCILLTGELILLLLDNLSD